MNVDQMIVRNILSLMQQKKMRFKIDLSRASGVSQTHVGCILNGEKSASPVILEKLARGLNVEAWQLLAPPELATAADAPAIKALLANYLRCDADGRETIARVAESQALLREDPSTL